MRRLTSFIVKLGSPIATKKYVDEGYFPNLVSHWDGSGNIVSRFFVDPINGSDENDGSSWDTAKKEISAVMAELPSDLQGRTVYIFALSGQYKRIFAQKQNGTISLFWVGTYANIGVGAGYDWLRNGKATPAVNNDAIVIQQERAEGFAQESKTGALLVMQPTTEAARFYFSINQADFGLFAASNWWNTSDYTYWNKIQFKPHADCDTTPIDATISIRNGASLTSDTGFTVYPAKNSAVAVYWGTFFTRALKVPYTGGLASSQTGTWAGLINVSNGSLCIPNSGSYLKFKSGFTPIDSAKYFEIGGCNQIACLKTTLSNYSANSIVLASALIAYTQDGTTAAKPIIRIEDGFNGYLEYSASQFNLEDLAETKRDIKEVDSAVLTSYLNQSEKIIGENKITKMGTSEVVDANLSNKEISFSIDETGNNLLVKVKYSDGTVKNGAIVLS